jgi:hypothetical protein
MNALDVVGTLWRSRWIAVQLIQNCYWSWKWRTQNMYTVKFFLTIPCLSDCPLFHCLFHCPAICPMWLGHFSQNEILLPGISFHATMYMTIEVPNWAVYCFPKFRTARELIYQLLVQCKYF